MSEYAAHEKRLKVRAFLSIGLFAVFTALALAVAISKSEELKYFVLVPFIGAYIALPRNIVLSEMEDATQRVYQKVQLWFSYLRIAYFLIALTLLFAVPRFV